jgi:hypothetical protein
MSPQIQTDKIGYARQGLAQSSRSFEPEIIVAAQTNTTPETGFSTASY